MTQDEKYPWPLFDGTVLARLLEDLDDNEGLWAVFIRNFVTQLPLRMKALTLSLTTGDMDGAINSALSLRTSCQMVGAERLAGLTLRIEDELRALPDKTGPSPALPHLAATHLAPLKACAEQTHRVLQDYLSQHP
ncbi:HPt (histidine-containing phosphotransfer) domain-containing protein [Arthrobacter oryzae]|uniref:Hpt domain-containing protein n=1 Tax=Arthrobacter TaxID=1663 RepID=UPI001F0109EE|nr:MULTISPECIES: Hpt domain-containing protein [Arthrobacter]MDP9989376.1 HPt (histidine-containing phosphotransfer) domain-containing protein [Arthrobacter oryzae]UKA71454.1 Hpt domain-containing protein [Arthrobacter sp. FW306-06-A]